jgi:two-component system sensor histidine kinase DesK
MQLLPKNEHGWAPYTWLAYFGFFYLDPILGHRGLKVWLFTALGTVIFLALYFGIFWLRGVAQWIDLGLLVVVGTIYAPYNAGASTFFIFAAALLPFVVHNDARAAKLLGVVVFIVVLDWRLFHLSGWFLLYAGGLSAVIGGSNIYFAQRNRMYAKLRIANDEIEHLAKVAERERIARDLHDVLGHTLSIIILKSELAGKLIDRDPERAKSEIRDVEQTSRTALSEVRNTIRGYRANSLEAELKQARATLETAGVTVQAEASIVPLTAAQESVIALVVREAVTNIVRHAKARNCRLRLAGGNGSCQLEIHDDGTGGAQVEGNGLRGMRERVEALGGTLKRDTRTGTCLTIEFPVNGSCR